MADSINIKAHAKVNLTLNVTGIKNNLHILESIVTSVDLADVIVLHKRTDNKIKVIMEGLDFSELSEKDNNAYKAASAFQAMFKTCGANIKICKNIPAGAGLGGSAADAAAVIIGLSRLYDVAQTEKMDLLAASISSDTLYMTKGGYGIIKGTGDIIESFTSPLKIYFLAVTVPGGVSTKRCFELFDKMQKTEQAETLSVKNALIKSDFNSFSKKINNMLIPAAKAINLGIAEALKDLSVLGAPVNMSGSGSTVYAVFDSLSAVKQAKNSYKGKYNAYILESVDEIYVC